MISMPHKSLLVVIIAWVIIAGAGCTDNNTSLLHQQSLIFCSDGAPDNFNPNVGTSFTDFNASSRVLFNRLVEIDDDNGNVIPSLASHWQISDDGLNYVLTLRPDIQFHTTKWFEPTRPMNATDVIFSFQRQLDTNHPFHGEGGYYYLHSTGLRDNLLSVNAMGDLLVSFELRAPDASFLYSLSMDFASILSKEYAEYIERHSLDRTQFDSLPVGTGPFKLNKYQDNSFIRYFAHADYYDGKSSIEHLIYAITPDSATRYARLVSGECDMMLNPPKSQYDLLVNDQDIQLLHEPGLNIGFMAFNIQKRPMSDIRFRTAIAMAINKPRINEQVYGDLGIINNSLIPPSMVPYHNANLTTVDFDPERAKAIIEELALGDISLELWALPVQRSYNPNGTLMAELIQEDLQAVGVQTTIVTYEWSTYLDKVNEGEHDLALLGWVADNHNPGDFLNALISCNAIDAKTNRTFWCSAFLDNLINEAINSQDIDQKRQRYFAIQSMIAEQLPLLPIATGEETLVARKSLKSISIESLGGVNFTRIEKGAE